MRARNGRDQRNAASERFWVISKETRPLTNKILLVVGSSFKRQCRVLCRQHCVDQHLREIPSGFQPCQKEQQHVHRRFFQMCFVPDATDLVTG